MNPVPNRQVICDELCDAAQYDRDILVLCSDSRGSASMTRFFELFPEQSVELGIAEQNLVSVAAGLARCGKKPFVFAPASFLTTRSIEQIKIDVAYSNTNVKLIGISGGVSYGALGMTHHSAQDIAMTSCIPNLRVYIPSDNHLTRKLIYHLIRDDKPAFIRVGRNSTSDAYESDSFPFQINQANILRQGNDVAIIVCGELTTEAVKAADVLTKKGIHCCVIDMYCMKPLDVEVIRQAVQTSNEIVTVEEHGVIGGLGALVAQVAASLPDKVRVTNLGLPDQPVICGNQKEVLAHYHLDGDGIAIEVEKILAYR